MTTTPRDGTLEVPALVRRAAEGRQPPARDVELLWVPVHALRINPAYQRRLSDRSTASIARIVKTFSWSRFGALVVTPGKGDTLLVVDGQHRAIAAAALGIASVPAIVTEFAATAGQAEAFVGVNTERTGVAATDKFRARVAAGDPQACAAQRLLEQHDISADVPPGSGLGPRQTRAVHTIERGIKRHGEGVVFTAIEALMDAAGDQPNLLTANTMTAVIDGTALLIEAGADLDAWIETLAEADFETLADEAQQLVRLQGGQKAKHTSARLIRLHTDTLKRRKRCA